MREDKSIWKLHQDMAKIAVALSYKFKIVMKWPKKFFKFCSGTYDIFVKREGVDEMVGCYDNKGSFGELALMYNTPR